MVVAVPVLRLKVAMEEVAVDQSLRNHLRSGLVSLLEEVEVVRHELRLWAAELADLWNCVRVAEGDRTARACLRTVEALSLIHI